MPAANTADRLLPLGTGTALLAGGRSAAGYLLDFAGQRLLVDCGPGTLLRLRQAGIDPAMIESVLLSHFHPDHHADLLGLLFMRHNPDLEAKAPLRVFAPPGIRRILAAWASVYGSWIEDDAGEIVEVDPGPFCIGELALTAHVVEHTLPAYAYRFEAGGRALAYSGDSDECDGLMRACEGADFVWLECSHPDDCAVSGHLSPGRIRNVLERAEPARCGLTHFYPPMFEWLADEARLQACFAGLTTKVQVLNDLEEVAL